MRNEEQVLKQILDFAQSDENIRAVIMNGSRVNPNIHHDIFSDYDIICFVHDLEKYVRDKSWIPYFGEWVIMQFNRHDEQPENQYVYLMQFADGVRIDLSFARMNMIEPSLEDSLTVVLLDKDQSIPASPDPNESSYITKKPNQAEYDLVVNEFWWVSTYVAKAIWRNEPVTAKYLFEVIVRDCLNRMVAWYIAMQHDWQINVGKMGKKFGSLLPTEVWQELLLTYPGIEEDAIWQALFRAGNLMRKLGVAVAENLEYTYHDQEDERVIKYLYQVMNLPKDAQSFD
ncbi:MAG: aminoglycoside 6-adenylyltransferase [Anaerolineaceae bacterium]|nr:aminoglycoside 6-adenylyltransferase [Anaerolineaceae bacterium]